MYPFQKLCFTISLEMKKGNELFMCNNTGIE